MLYDLLRKYSSNHHIRTVIRILPKGNSLDFWLIETWKRIQQKEHAKRSAPLLEAVIDMAQSRKLTEEQLVVRRVPVYTVPQTIRFGEFQLTKREQERADKIRKILCREKRPDDPCAVICEEPNWSDDPVRLVYVPALYSDILSRKRSKMVVQVLSVNVLVFSEEERCVVLHRRSEISDDFGKTIHTLGGGFIPGGFSDKGDSGGMRECGEREIREETGVAIQIPESTPMAFIDECGIQFIQIAFLGVNITREQVKRFRPNWEGTVVKISFDDLCERLKSPEDWTPSGWAHTTMWLALGTPGCKKPLRFGKLSHEKIIHEIIA